MVFAPLLNTLVLLILFVIPLLTPAFGLGFEKIKVLFFLYLTSLALFFYALIISQKKGKFIVWNKINVTSLVFLGILLISSLLGKNLQASFFGKPPYVQGFFTYLYLIVFYILVQCLDIKPKYFTLVFSISAFLVSFLAIKDWLLLTYFNVPVLTYAGRVVSSFGQPNLYSGYLLLTLPLLLSLELFSSKALKSWLVISALASIVAILISQSKAAILLTLFFLLWYFMSRFKNLRTVFVVLSCAAFLFALILSTKFTTGLAWTEIVGPLISNNPQLTNNSLEKRIYIWPVLGQLILQRPILGYGPENISSVLPTYKPSEDIRATTVFGVKDMYLDRAHNYSLDLLLYSGLLGFVSWVILIWLLAKKGKNRVYLASLIIYLVWIQFQIQSIVHLMFFWWLAGMINKQEKVV